MAQMIHILGEGGTIFAMDLPLHEAIADRLAKGYLKRVNADGTPYREDSERTQPPPYGSKADWVGWAVYASAKAGKPVSPDDAEALTKQDLIELYGVK